MHVRINSAVPFETTSITIHALLKSSDDIMELMLLVDATRRLNTSGKQPVLVLFLPYIPYARQDRVCNEGESLSIQVMANMINSLGADIVFVEDPHSDVAPALINNCRIIGQLSCFFESVPQQYRDNGVALVSPDAGAVKKVFALSQRSGLPAVYATKHRNPETGEIFKTSVDLGPLRPKRFLIVDDICDGGRTFVELAKAIRENYHLTPVEVSLYVTHGIFSKGVKVLRDSGIDHLFAKNVWSENIDYCSNDFVDTPKTGRIF